jgi:pimeloyl-ACP methyl ester carboxylesterase
MAGIADQGWTDGDWSSRDGLKLHYRDYAGAGISTLPPVLCLHGLTRNARDFDVLAPRLAATRRVLCPDMRGRGDSEYAKDSATYNPLQYVDDVVMLLDHLGIGRAVIIGTSLGGLMTMILAMIAPHRIAAAVLNDIGPEVDPAGIAKIRGYLGQGRSFPTWMHAARALEEAHGATYPGWQIADWLAMAKRIMTLAPNGRIVFDYDMRIAEPFSQPGGEGAADLWPGLKALAGRPLLVVRGETSDILSAPTLAAMLDAMPDAEAVTIPGTGHVPTLDEPDAVAAIERLLARAG